MILPLLVSVPHAGLRVPDEVASYCILTEQQIIEDGDEGAAEIYDFPDAIAQFVTTDIARAIVDMNRAEDDCRADGVVKTHTCWNVPVYDPFPPDGVIGQLLARHYRPYHARLTECSAGGVRLGVDCHTMAALGPPIGPGAGEERPAVCLSNGDGTCPAEWLESMARCFEQAFERDVAINDPFRGGYIIRAHADELPWMQVELSRAPFLSNAEKRKRVLAALAEWCGMTG
ncbi:MAG: N-formylglutamate amidohydrolase [Planctomycetota bacterium]|nr:N-formylglutamate amidohydrolase [Planctomycetota bacterium]